MEHKNFSLSQQVFDRLENEILCGVYQRGEILTESVLSENLGVSRTPIREALGRLEQEHLVESTGKGIRILGVTTEDLEDIYEIRLEIEPLAAQRAAERMTEEELKKLGETLEMQEFFLQKKDAERIKTMDSDFHEQLYRYAGSAVYYDVLMPLHTKVQKFRKASLQKGSRAEASVKEHRMIYEAVASRDLTRVAETMKRHIQNAKANILKEN